MFTASMVNVVAERTNSLTMCTYLESPQYSMSTVSNQKPFWAVLLAGGDGARLRSLTLKIAGDSRPKQFCRIFGDKSLLGHTRERLRPLFREDRTIFVVTKAHEAFYREDLFDADAPRVVAQPRNRGTGVAIAVAVLRVLQRDADAIVAFFPCDHYYGDETVHARVVTEAMRQLTSVLNIPRWIKKPSPA